MKVNLKMKQSDEEGIGRRTVLRASYILNIINYLYVTVPFYNLVEINLNWNGSTNPFVC